MHPAARVRALWAERRVLWLLIRRDLKVKYADSALGYVWSVLDPLLMVLIYFVVFSLLFHRGRGAENPYIVYLAFGQLAWGWFNGSLTESCRALIAEKRLVRSTSLPREIWVLKIVGSRGIEYLLSLPVVIIFVIGEELFGQHIQLDLRFLPLFLVGLVMQAVLCTGLSLLLASVTVLVTDLARVVRIVLRMLFYMTPVLYSASEISSHKLREVYAANPMGGCLELYRAVVFHEHMQGPKFILTGMVVAVLSFAVGSWVFTRLESPVLKEL